ncbi:MAG: ATP-binding protein [Syntrophomonas sp.]
MLHKILNFLFGDKNEEDTDNKSFNYRVWINRRQKKIDKAFKGMTLDELENEGFISKTDKERITELCTGKGVNTIIVGERRSGKSLLARALANEIPGTYIEVLTKDEIINPYRDKPTKDAVVVVDTVKEDNLPNIRDAKNAIVICGGSVNEALSFIEKNYGIETANSFSVVIETALFDKDGMPYVKYYGAING